MGVKMLEYGLDARDQMLKGVNILADAVCGAGDECGRFTGATT